MREALTSNVPLDLFRALDREEEPRGHRGPYKIVDAGDGIEVAAEEHTTLRAALLKMIETRRPAPSTLDLGLSSWRGDADVKSALLGLSDPTLRGFAIGIAEGTFNTVQGPELLVDFYLNEVEREVPGSRFVIGWSAKPPLEDVAFCIMEQDRAAVDPRAQELLLDVLENPDDADRRKLLGGRLLELDHPLGRLIVLGLAETKGELAAGEAEELEALRLEALRFGRNLTQVVDPKSVRVREGFIDACALRSDAFRYEAYEPEALIDPLWATVRSLTVPRPVPVGEARTLFNGPIQKSLRELIVANPALLRAASECACAPGIEQMTLTTKPVKNTTSEIQKVWDAMPALKTVVVGGKTLTRA